MVRSLNRFSAVELGRLATQAGQHHDGGGLYLVVGRQHAPGASSWVFRYMLDGRARTMGLGAYPHVGLKDARSLAIEARKATAKGVDPLDQREAERLLARTEAARRRIEAAKEMTFEDCATAYIAAHRPGWKNAKHADQWTNTLKSYAYPIFGPLPVQSIDTTLVRKALEPIWSTKNETATRLRGRIESVLDWAKVREYRDGENPARWKGHLDKLLPSPGKVRHVKHHSALPFGRMAMFMTALRERPGISALALEFTILTAARTRETREARWSELDLRSGIWSISAARMKNSPAGHRVPLSTRAIEILQDIAKAQGYPSPTSYVFAGRNGDAMSDMSLLAVIKRMNVGAAPRWVDADGNPVVPHGFRSTFRDWCGESGVDRELAELSLAHAMGNKTEQAYRRGDALERRRPIMENWARYCSGALGPNVSLLRAAST